MGKPGAVAKIALTRPYPEHCIEFEGATHSQDGYRYGVLRHEGKTARAHRVSYCMAHGLKLSDIAGMEVRHTCDNPPCVNPKHLLLGTHADNMRDMFSRGRRKAAVGERVGTAKLTADDVRKIRAENSAGILQRDLAKAYGLTSGAVSRVCARKTWRHVE